MCAFFSLTKDVGSVNLLPSSSPVSKCARSFFVRQQTPLAEIKSPHSPFLAEYAELRNEHNGKFVSKSHPGECGDDWLYLRSGSICRLYDGKVNGKSVFRASHFLHVCSPCVSSRVPAGSFFFILPWSLLFIQEKEESFRMVLCCCSGFSCRPHLAILSHHHSSRLHFTRHMMGGDDMVLRQTQRLGFRCFASRFFCHERREKLSCTQTGGVRKIQRFFFNFVYFCENAGGYIPCFVPVLPALELLLIVWASNGRI